MNALAALDSLYEVEFGEDLPLPAELAALYGRLQFPVHGDRAYVIGNFVTTIDGVVTLNVPGKAGGGPISGFDQHDHAVMGLLRAVSDAVIVGAGTQRVAARHLWTAEYICPELAGAYRQLRKAMGVMGIERKSGAPLNVIVTGSGEVDFGLPVFQSGQVPVLVVTTVQGEERIRGQGTAIPPHVQVSGLQGAGSLSAGAILEAVRRARRCDIVLVEGGPRLLGDFFAERLLDELFLTLAPQIAGRNDAAERAGLVMGKLFAPEHPLWGKLKSVKRGGSHLFLRYGFEARE